MNQETLKIGAIATALGVHPRTIKRRIAEGKFPEPLRIGRACRWQAADLATYLDSLKAARTPMRRRSA